MSKFYNYLNEKSILDNFDMENFKNDCYPYLKELKKGGYHFLYSGRRSNEVMFKKSVRKDRRPLNTPLKIHKMLDEQFKSKFGVKPRSNSIFAHLESVRTHFYGNTFYIFPTGNKYSLIWNEDINDLFIYLDIHINRAISKKGKKTFGQRLSDLIWNFQDNDILRYNENTDRFEAPRQFMSNTSKEHYEKMMPLTKSEFFGMLDNIISEAVSGYKQTKTISKDMDCEVMIVASDVWLINQELANERNFRIWIEENIK